MFPAGEQCTNVGFQRAKLTFNKLAQPARKILAIHSGVAVNTSKNNVVARASH